MIPRSRCPSHCEPVSRALALALLLLFAPSAPGQQVSPPADALAMAGDAEALPTIQKSVDEVNMLFTVTDHSGHPVHGLTGADFTVTDRQVPSPITFFQSETDAPLRIAVAIDLSGSVAPKVKYEVRVATEFLARVMRPGDTAEIIGFGTRPYAQRDLAKASECLLALVQNDPRMGTAVYDVVRRTCAEMAAAAGVSRHRSILLLITDGEDNASRSTAGDALRAVEESGVIAFVVYTGGQDHPAFLRRLTKVSGGRIFDGSTSSRVAAALAKVTTILREQYLIAYRPRDLRRDGSFHEVKIAVQRRNLRVYCRRGYYAVAGRSPR